MKLNSAGVLSAALSAWLVLPAATVLAKGDSAKVDRTREVEKTRSEQFCSKTSGKEAKDKCETWIVEQKKTLGKRLLTSRCTDGELSDLKGCLYQSKGTVSYVLRETVTETKDE